MAKMKSDASLDYAVFQLSPKRSRCELFVSSDGSTEKLASGLLKPFVSHLKIAAEQVASAAQSVKLEVGRHKKAEMWFTKGTLEKFVRFVSTPEVLELVNTLDAEMSQLEAARRIYSQGAGDQLSGGSSSGDDATKKELLRAIDVRLIAARQDLSSACSRAAAAGFNIHTVSQLHKFADSFGAHRLNDACSKFISLNERRPEITHPCKSEADDRAVRSSYGSDMSIDDDDATPSPPPRVVSQPPPDLKIGAFNRKSSIERESQNKPNKIAAEKDETIIPDQPESIQASQPARRLSVQDRINMFENKQKENSGGKPAVLRSSSDVSVMRRWSGASDMSMSIDLSAEKDTDSYVATTNVSNLNSGSAEVSSAAKAEIKDAPSSDRGGDGGSKGVSLASSEQLFKSIKNSSNLGSFESDVLKDKTGSRSFISRNDDQDSTEDVFKALDTVSRNEGVIGFENQGKLRVEEFTGSKTPMAGNLVVFDKTEPSESRDEPIKEVGMKAAHKSAAGPSLDGDAGSRIRLAFASRYKGTKGNSSSAQESEVSERKEYHMFEKASLAPVALVEAIRTRKTEVVAKKESQLSEKVVMNLEDSRPPIRNFSKQVSTAETVDTQEVSDSFSTPTSQYPGGRQSKGNQELDELKMKANELEKMFAEHKLRAPIDQPNSARKGRLGDAQREPSSSLQYTKPTHDITSDNYQSAQPSSVSKNSTKFDFSSPMRGVDSHYDSNAMDKSFSDLSISESSRGKFYDRYMQKRDAKLRNDWSVNREEKEARLKSMQDSLERNKSDMKVRIFGSAERQDSISSARRRAERLRSYNSRSNMKREQQNIDFGDSDDDEEASDFPEHNKDVNDGVSRGKKHLAVNRSLLTTPRTSAPIPRSAGKSCTISSGKRRMQPDNPLAQSVPNFSDMRKENTKPFGANKTSRSQARSYARSKSINDEAAVVRDDKSRRSQSLRKSSANPTDFNDDVDIASTKLNEENPKNVVTKPFLRKGSRKSFVAQSSIAREKISEAIHNEEEDCEMESGPEEYLSIVGYEGEEELESLKNEDPDVSDNGETKQELEQEKSTNSGSENGDNDSALTFSLVDQALGSKLPIRSSFQPIESVPDWSGESPISWNSHSQHPFCYPNEMSDIDPSADSSPASWNQIESDAARMRKKWGAAQKPILSDRKDMTRGFKRLLKFGRKSRGSESLADWISATTSEGDDDVEDGRDIGNRSSEDLRKSRMGFSHGQASEDSFNDCEDFNESAPSLQNSIPAPATNFKLREDHMSGSSIKAPRSFFSLSTFRSKGSDSKLR